MSEFKSVSKKRPQFRKRQQQSSSEEENEDLSKTIEKNRVKKPTRGLHQSTSGACKKDGAKATMSSSDEENNENPPSSSVASTSYKSSRSGKSEGPGDMGATAELEMDTEQDKHAQAIIDKARKAQRLEEEREKETVREKQNVAFYKGQYAYDSSLESRQRYGPQAAPLNIRVTTRWDYAPDICKDYKETGTCGFGDSCKFLHDRSDFKFGWQLDAEADNENYGQDDYGTYEIPSEDETMVPKMPDTCWVCREAYTNPVETRCEHFFCEKCFLNEVVPNKMCPVCSRPTDGYAKDASKLRLEMQRKMVV